MLNQNNTQIYSKLDKKMLWKILKDNLKFNGEH